METRKYPMLSNFLGSVSSLSQKHPYLTTLGVITVTAVLGVTIRHLRRARRERRVLAKYGFIPDQLSNLAEVQEALTRCGMPACELLLGIDYGERNCTSGQRTFRGENLHRIIPGRPDPNPYQYALFLIAKTMQVFDSDGRVPCYAMLGDFRLHPMGETEVLGDLLSLYNARTPSLFPSGHPSWKLLLDQAIEHVIETRRYHLLLVLTTGAVDQGGDELRDALAVASRFPLSVVAIGVGDGPFDELRAIDDERIPGRLFDNFQFFNLHEILAEAKFLDVAFALATLMEVPFQYSAIKELGLL